MTINRFQQRHEQTNTITLEDAAKEWVASKEKEDYSSKHLTDMRFVTNAQVECLGANRQAATIDNHDLVEWLEPWRKSRGFVHNTCLPYSDNRKPQPMTIELGPLIGRWRDNGLRAFRASYRLAETNNLSHTALEDGHTEYILRKNYLNPRFAENAELWFSISPSKAKELNTGRIRDFKQV